MHASHLQYVCCESLCLSVSLSVSLSVFLSLSLCFTHTLSLSLPSLFLSQAMKSGLYDVLPVTVLEGLTAEDMRLLLCGCQQVELDILKKITTFTDESRKLHSHDMIITFVIMYCTCLVVERSNHILYPQKNKACM